VHRLVPEGPVHRPRGIHQVRGMQRDLGHAGRGRPTLGVDPGARGRGIARALIDACFDLARGAGRSYVTLHTTQRMKAAQAMYRTLGFERLQDRVFPDGFVLLTYRKPIPRA
jgi:ribosomal protein S18 acetylase RimI-like enzyme